MQLLQLSVKNLYPLIKKLPQISRFFPDYEGSHLPDRDYFFKVSPLQMSF